MKISVTHVKRAVVAGSLFGFLLFPSIGMAEPVTVQTQGNRSDAFAGESGARVEASAVISVLVTRPSDGNEVPFLGSTIGNGTSEITLPAGWLLYSTNIPRGACALVPTQFYYSGGGRYNIRVVPQTTEFNGTCKWFSGDYHYVVRIAGTFNNVDGPGTSVFFRGSGLGVLTIP